MVSVLQLESVLELMDEKESQVNDREDVIDKEIRNIRKKLNELVSGLSLGF